MVQQYGTMAPYPQHCARPSSLYFSVFACTCKVIRWIPLPTLSDNAITDRYSDTLIFQLRAYRVWISWSTGSEKSFRHVPPMEVELSNSCMNGEHPIVATWPGAPHQYAKNLPILIICLFKNSKTLLNPSSTKDKNS